VAKRLAGFLKPLHQGRHQFGQFLLFRGQRAFQRVELFQFG